MEALDTADDAVQDAAVAAPRRPGELTTGWYVASALTWVGVVVALAAVWNTSRQLGLAVWWLGPPAQAKPVIVSLLPFVLPVAMTAAALERVRYLPWFGLGASAVTAVIGLVDITTFPRLALAQVAIAVAAAVTSVASLSGMYRAGVSVDEAAAAPGRAIEPAHDVPLDEPVPEPAD